MNPRAEKIVPPGLLRGQFLREQRLRAGIAAREMAFLLDLSEDQLGLLEGYNLVLADLPLAAAQVIGVSDQPKLEGYVLPGGNLMLNWRKTFVIGVDELAGGVSSAKAALKLVEEKNWPIPPEWLPEMRKRGFLRSGPDHPKIFRNRALDAAQVEEGGRRLREGENLQQVTYAMGVSIGALRRGLAAAGIVIPKWAKASWRWKKQSGLAALRPSVGIDSRVDQLPRTEAFLLLERAAAILAARGLPPPPLKTVQLGRQKKRAQVPHER